MANSRVILGIDIGSTKIATVVGVLHPSRGLILRGLSVVPTQAIARGTIRDINQATHDIDESYSGAMYSSGMAGGAVFVGITGRELYSQTRRATLVIDRPGGEVTNADVAGVIAASMPDRLEAGQQVVQSMVREFALDGIRTNRSPVGMIGKRLEVETHVVVGWESQIANIERALSRIELKVSSYVLNLIAAGESVLSAEDRNAGSVLIDFGGGTTNAGIFLGGTLAFSACIPVGGAHYDHDLKHGLGVSFEEAHRIKKSYGKAWLEANNDELEEFVDIKYYGRREFDKVKRRRIYDIMQPRTEELVERIAGELNNSGLLPRIAGGIVICGGGAQLRQLRRYLQRQLGRQVRVGLPTGIGHLLDEYRTPAYAAPLGLLIYGSKYEEPQAEAGVSFVTEVGLALKDLVSGLISRRGRRQDET